MAKAIDTCVLEVFGDDTSSPVLRWHDGATGSQQRSLRRSDLDEFVERVDDGYRATAPDLVGLGRDLYRWLDGPTERWLAAARERRRPILLQIDCSERLRALPWELLWDDDFLAIDAARPVIPVRRVSKRVLDPVEAQNRPLRLAFMASSPTDVRPVLAFEQEEATILAAAPQLIDLVVEESGSLNGLGGLFQRFGPDHFDGLHLSGHATTTAHGPRFVMEDDFGLRLDASAEDIADEVDHHWPALTFLSACHTAGAPSGGDVASMSEALVDAGARAVLGWGLPVGDDSATALASTLYESLANGSGLEWSVTRARRELHKAHSPFWHLLRLHVDSTPFGGGVTPPGTPNRVLLRNRSVSELFLDESGQVRVAGEDGFVGRRRQLQRSLAALRSTNPTDAAHILVLHGLGGLGKSTTAMRLLDRMRPSHPRHAVWVGKIDSQTVLDLSTRVSFDPGISTQVDRLLNLPDQTLAQRLRFVFDGPLADLPCVFVFDDFENGNLEPDGTGGHVCQAQALEVITGFADAIQNTGSLSRVIITSRHAFPVRANLRFSFESFRQFRDADLDKKLLLTKHLRPGSDLPEQTRLHAIETAAGIPRLIERIDELIDDPQTDHAALLDAITHEAVDYREKLLLDKLLTQQGPDVRRLLCYASIYNIPVPATAIEALLDDGSVSDALARSTSVGLLEKGVHPSTGEDRYLVSPLVKPLLDDIKERLIGDERTRIAQLAARSLFDLWVNDGE